MAYRYTNTDKWDDAWFVKLKPLEKLLFNYLCDKCDIAGFIEINTKIWSAQIGTNIRNLEGALKGLQRGLILSDTNDCIYLRTFLKHQKNLPLNPEKNMAHRGIIKRFELYSFKFSIKNIFEFVEGACKGLGSPYGNGIGIGNGTGNEEKGSGGKQKFIPPTLEEVEIYFVENGYSAEAAKKAFQHYNLANWHDTNGKPVLNWKQKMNTIWFKDENKIKPDKRRVDGYVEK